MNQPPAGLRWPDDTTRAVATPGIVLAARILVFVQAALVAVSAISIAALNKFEGRALGGASIIGLVSLGLFAFAAAFAPGRDGVRQVLLLTEGLVVVFDLIPVIGSVVTAKPVMLLLSLLGLILPVVVLSILYSGEARRYFTRS